MTDSNLCVPLWSSPYEEVSHYLKNQSNPRNMHHMFILDELWETTYSNNRRIAKRIAVYSFWSNSWWFEWISIFSVWFLTFYPSVRWFWCVDIDWYNKVCNDIALRICIASVGASSKLEFKKQGIQGLGVQFNSNNRGSSRNRSYSNIWTIL